MKEKQFLKLFKSHITDNHDTQADAARTWGVSPQYVSMVVNGMKAPNALMLADMGYTRGRTALITYTPIEG